MVDGTCEHKVQKTPIELCTHRSICGCRPRVRRWWQQHLPFRRWSLPFALSPCQRLNCKCDYVIFFYFVSFRLQCVVAHVGRTNKTLCATYIVEDKDRPHFLKEFFCHFIYTTLYVFGVVSLDARWCDCIFGRGIFSEMSSERGLQKPHTASVVLHHKWIVHEI